MGASPYPDAYTLLSHESIEIRVRANTRESNHEGVDLVFTDDAIRALLEVEGTLLGTVNICYHGSLNRTIDIRGLLKAGPTFTLSADSLHLCSLSEERIDNDKAFTQKDHFFIKNVSLHAPLQFEVLCPQEVKSGASVSAYPSAGLIAPDKSLRIEVSLTLSAAAGTVNEDLSHLQLTVRDLQMNNSAQVVPIYLHSYSKPIYASRIRRSDTEPEQSLAEENKKSPNHPSTDFRSWAANIKALDVLELKRSTTNGSTSNSMVPSPMRPVRHASMEPLLILKGCSSTGDNRYEINMAQQTYSTSSREWELTLENGCEGIAPIEYRVYLLNDVDETWLTLSRTCGVLQQFREFHSLTVLASTSQLGVFSTYIVIENRCNPSDIKMIRVRLEVVASYNPDGTVMGTEGKLPSDYFTVLIDGSDLLSLYCRESIAQDSKERDRALSTVSTSVPEREKDRDKTWPVIDFGDVFYNVRYTNRSFVIVNNSNLSMDFILSRKVKSPRTLQTGNLELNFSLSSTVMRPCETVTVDAKNSLRVYLHLYVSSFAPTLKTGTAGEDNSATSASNTAGEVESTVDVSLELNINCRLLKDYQQIIVGRARCYPQQMSLSASELLFALPFGLEAVTTSATVSPVIQPDQHRITVHNRLPSQPLSLIVRNDANGFLSELTEENGEMRILVKPNIVWLQSNPDAVTPGKYIQEHLSVYNRSNLNERYFIVLRLTCGNIPNLSLAPSCPNKLLYTKLEDRVTSFLRVFTVFWDLFLHDPRAVMTKSNLPPTPTGTHDSPISLMDGNGSNGNIEGAVRLCEIVSPVLGSHAILTDEVMLLSELEMELELLAQEEKYNSLFFEFYYVADQIKYTGWKGDLGKPAFYLGNLLYSVVFKHKLFRLYLRSRRPLPPLLLPWADQLRFFIEQFPSKREFMLPLADLYRDLARLQVTTPHHGTQDGRARRSSNDGGVRTANAKS
eukprot:GILK01011366.1.p1 GENE.GILK01011366.1~~GILK01011366.1.p1  ORF type:complete len:1105 (-),score=175.64 GILK01011366.1:100-2979(-)